MALLTPVPGTRVTADSLSVKVKNGRLDLRRNFFSGRASSLWNTVPADIKRMMPVHLFKKAYKRHRETDARRLGGYKIKSRREMRLAYRETDVLQEGLPGPRGATLQEARNIRQKQLNQRFEL